MVKRILAALLTVAMLLSVCSVEAFAAENSGSDLWWQYPSEDPGTTEAPETTEDPETCAHDGEFIYQYELTYIGQYELKDAHNKICAKCGTVVEKGIDCDVEIIRAVPINMETMKELADENIYLEITPQYRFQSTHFEFTKCKYCGNLSTRFAEHDIIDDEKVDLYEITENGHMNELRAPCKVCGDLVLRGYTEFERPHQYNDPITGKCACGKERPDCDHASTKIVDVVGDDLWHNIVCTDKCGEIQDIETHTYKDGICEVCGHKCTHNGASEILDYDIESLSYSDNGDGTHTSSYTYSIICAYCGLEAEMTVESIGYHIYYFGVCYCGRVKPSEGIPAASVDYDTLEALKDEFLEEYNSDMVNLIIEDASDTVSDEDKKLVELDTNYTVGLYLNIELENWKGPVTETKTMIPITIAIPEEYLATGRTFSIVRVHDGIVTVLKDEDSDPRTITFSTNQFSTYAIVYKDTVAVEEQEDKGTSVGRTPDMPTAPFGAYVVDMGDNHGIIYGGHIISMPHTYNAAGVCTSCGHER